MGCNNSRNKVTNLQGQSLEEMDKIRNDEEQSETQKQEENEEENKPKSFLLKRIITIIITIASLIEPIYSSIIAMEAYNNFNDLSDQLKIEVTDRYDYKMISDIKVANNCYGEYEPLFMYMFKGTNLRCDCTGKLNNNITPDFCSNEQNAAGCTQYNPIKEKVLSVYPQGINDSLKQQICFKNYNKQTFKQIKDWPTQCQAGYKMCGNVSGKSKESNFCILQSEVCPINSIVLGQTNPDKDIYDEQIQFNSTHIMFMSRKSDKLPLNYNKVTSGEGPCYNITQENTYPDRIDHFTFKEQRKSCSIDPRWDRVAEIGEYTFFKSSGITPEDYFKEIWSSYKISNDYRYGFYVSHYPDWKYEKRDLLVIIIEFVDNREQIMYFQQGLFIINIVNLGINVILSFLLVRQYCIAVDENLKDELAKKKDIFNNLIKIAQIAACIYQISEIVRYLDAFKQCHEFSVSDDRTNGIIENVNSYMDQKVYEADKKMIISNCVGFIVAIFGLIFSLVMKKKQQKK